MNIIVLCTGNSCRSQIAEGFLKKYLGEEHQIRSAGLEPMGVNEKAIKVMNEIGIDISSHTSNNLNEYLSDNFDYIITVCGNAENKCPVFPGEGIKLHFPFDDPAHAEGSENDILAEFRRVRDLIGIKITEWLRTKEFI